MSWQFARTLKWIVRHVLVAALVVVMVNLGFWQLRRLDDKKDYKALVEGRQEQPAEPVEDVLPVGAAVDSGEVDDVLYRSVTAEGEYRADETVVVENRTYNGASGGWVLTPLDLGDGTAVLVNRGFIGFDQEGRIVAPPPADGAVQVEGLLFPSQERGSFGAPRSRRGPTVGGGPRGPRLASRRRSTGDLLPAYVQLVESDPPEPRAAAGEPQLVPLGPPEPEEGPHLAYAVQWFIFSTIAAGGYVLLLRQRGPRRPAPADTSG